MSLDKGMQCTKVEVSYPFLVTILFCCHYGLFPDIQKCLENGMPPPDNSQRQKLAVNAASSDPEAVSHLHVVFGASYMHL